MVAKLLRFRYMSSNFWGWTGDMGAMAAVQRLLGEGMYIQTFEFVRLLLQKLRPRQEIWSQPKRNLWVDLEKAWATKRCIKICLRYAIIRRMPKANGKWNRCENSNIQNMLARTGSLHLDHFFTLCIVQNRDSGLVKSTSIININLPPATRWQDKGAKDLLKLKAIIWNTPSLW